MGKVGYYTINLTKEDLQNYTENISRESSQLALMSMLARKYNVKLSYNKYFDVISYRRLIKNCMSCQKVFMVNFNFLTEEQLLNELERFKINLCDECIVNERNRLLREKIVRIKANFKDKNK